MNEYYEIFERETQKYFVRGSRNNNLPAVCFWAVKCEVDYSTLESYVRGQFGSDWTKLDENSLKRAWEKVSKDTSIVPISQYKSENKSFNIMKFVEESKEAERKLAEELKNYDINKKFNDFLESLKKKYDVVKWKNDHKPAEQPKDSSFMLKIFSEDDWVWMGEKPFVENLVKEVKDVKSFAEKHQPLTWLNFFVINPLKDPSGRSDVDVKTFKYMLLEADELDLRDQYRLMIDFIERGLPIKMATFTGNKSLHLLVKVNGISTKYEWDAYVDDIFSSFRKVKTELFDEKCKNPSRLSRTPSAIRKDEKVLEDTPQKLVYIQEDEEKLKGDAREIIIKWCDEIVGEEDTSLKEEAKDEIGNDELLYLFKSRERVKDIWDDGCFKHTLMLSPHFGEDGEEAWQYEDMLWKSDASFYNFISQELKEQYGVKIGMKDMKKFFIRFKKHEKFPYIGEIQPVKRNLVNVFIPGWLHKALTDDSIPSTLNEPLEKFLHNIFGDQELERRWTLQWMREFMHTFKVITAPVFWEIQGTGKTMLSKAFGEAIGDWIKTPPKKDDIQFNAWQDHTVIIFEESSSGSKRDGKDLGDLLKDWITETQKTIEAKGKDPVKKTIRSCFIFNANISEQVGPVFIEDTDRRYTIIRNEEAVDLQKVWTRQDFDKWDSKEYQMRLMKYIYNLPVDESINVRRGIDNAWKQQVIEMSKNNLEVAVEGFVRIHQGFYTVSDMMMEIRDREGIATTTRAIGNIMKKLGFISKTRRVLGKPQVGYDLCGEIEVEEEEKEKEDTSAKNRSIDIDIDKIFDE